MYFRSLFFSLPLTNLRFPRRAARKKVLLYSGTVDLSLPHAAVIFLVLLQLETNQAIHDVFTAYLNPHTERRHMPAYMHAHTHARPHDYLHTYAKSYINTNACTRSPCIHAYTHLRRSYCFRPVTSIIGKIKLDDAVHSHQILG